MEPMKDEFRALMALALPSMLSTYSLFAISLTELGVMGHLGVDQLAAVSYSQMMMDLATLVFMQGFNAGMNSLCSQAFGAKNWILLGHYAQLTAFVRSCLCIPLAVLYWYLGDLLLLAGVSESVASYAITYSRVSILAMWPRGMFQILTVFYQAQHIVLPTTIFNVITVAVNLLLTLGLTYGMFGLPELGFIGCPIGATIALWIRLFAFVYYMGIYKRYHAQCHLQWDTTFLQYDAFSKLVFVGMPLAAGTLFENTQLQTMTVFAGVIGEVQLGAHSAMLELFFFATSPIFGVTTSAVTRVGSYLGAGSHHKARQVARISGGCIATIAVVNSAFVVGFRNHLGYVFSEDDEVINLFGQVCSMCGIAYLILSFFYYSAIVLRAQARPTPLMIGFGTGAWVVGVPTAYLLGLAGGRRFFLGIWIGMLCGYTVTSAIGFQAAYFHANWEEESIKAVDRSRRKKGELGVLQPLQA